MLSGGCRATGENCDTTGPDSTSVQILLDVGGTISLLDLLAARAVVLGKEGARAVSGTEPEARTVDPPAPLSSRTKGEGDGSAPLYLFAPRGGSSVPLPEEPAVWQTAAPRSSGTDRALFQPSGGIPMMSVGRRERRPGGSTKEHDEQQR